MKVSSTTEVDWVDDRNLAATATSSGLTSAVTSWVRFALQFSATVIVSRIIGPEQYGAAAALLVAVTGAEVIRCGGVTWLVAHEARLTPAATSTLHRLSRSLGAISAVAWCVVAALPIAHGLPWGPWGAIAMAVVFFAAGSGAVPTAVLSRNLRSGAVGAAEVGAAAISCVIAVALARVGAGEGALLAQAATYALALRLGVALSCPWRPSRALPVSELRAQLKFVLDASGVQALEWLVRSLDRVFVASVFGTAVCGLYVQANQLVLLPLEQINGPLRRVAVPVLALLRNEPARLRSAFVTAMTLSCAALWPVFAVLGVLAEPVIRLVFGADWLGTVGLFRAMLPAAIASVVIAVTVFLALARGAARRQLRWELGVSRPLTILAFVVTAPLGVHAMLLAVSAATVITVVPGFLVTARSTSIRLRDLVRATWRPAVLALLCATTAGTVRHLLPTDVPELLPAGGAAAVMWCIGLLLIKDIRGVAIRYARRRRA